MLWYNGGTILERRDTMVEHLSFNIAVNLTGILGMIFMLFSVGFHPSLESSHSKWLKMLMILFIGAALSDLIVCIFSGRPNAAGVLNMAFTVKMLLDSLMLLVFLAYLRGSLGMKPNQWRGGTRIIVASSIVLMLTMALNPLHQLYFTSSGCRWRKVSTKPAALKMRNFSRSWSVKPAFMRLVLGFFRSISSAATLRSPHTTTGFTASSFCKYAKKTSSHSMR